MSEADPEVKGTDRRQSRGTQSDPPVSVPGMGAREKHLKMTEEGKEAPRHGDSPSRET